ncbi:uncharacterized protein LOC121371803 isoform X2 [Gigantopelta aegis]|uniref:uncharacterized protein LOC121371803 isoform X2 n=1 Tax=Gigantopelta aegis TaxID=1735272 RepID=UPI001B88BD36|nr:uncharacterized protein LOC121371803 isoform X2 [Gigantopelta aegis]
MANVFHVEFGINDTPLTRALEHGNYTTAERVIVECTNPSYLDEGCYQRTPLFICLCGVDEEEERVTTRNFFLARIIIEHGANVNYRVPQTLFGSEYIGPGKTCLELLVDFYNDLTHDGDHYNIKTWQMYHRGWDPAVDIVVGLDRQYLSTVSDILDHMEELILIILSNSGDPNILDENRMTLIHRIAMVSRDTRLVRLLCDFGANINAVDNYGNTPLLSLCDVSVSDVYDFMEDLSPSSDDTLEDNRASLCVRDELLTFLLSKRELELDTQNNLGQTAVFHCVLRGDVDSVYRLLKHGANPALRGIVWETRKRKRKLSPLFASFLSIPVQRSLNWQNMHHKLTAAPHQLAHLVDAGFFTRKEIVEELQEYLVHTVHFTQYDLLQVSSRGRRSWTSTWFTLYISHNMIYYRFLHEEGDHGGVPGSHYTSHNMIYYRFLHEEGDRGGATGVPGSHCTLHTI